MLRDKKGRMIIIIFSVIVVAVLVTTLVLVLGNKQDVQEQDYQSDISEGKETNNESKEEKKDLADFWINEYEFPNTTKEFNLNLFDNVAGVPVDLTKLENGNYTFNYRIFNYDIVEPGEYSVKKLSEIKGERFSSSQKDITVKTQDGEDLFEIILENNSDNEKITFYDSIKNNWWKIPLEADSILGKDVENVGEYDGDIIVEKAIENMGRPTYIYAWFGNTNLKLDENGIGGVIYDIVYHYNEFKIVLSVSEVVNNTTVGRWVELTGFTYYTNESFEAMIKDIQRKYTITDVLPTL